jgi:hypothetical protein
MKLRLKSNTVRFRTTRSEVATLIATGCLEETIQFKAGDNGAFTFAIALESHATRVDIRYASSTITLCVPADQARTWAQSDAVGIYAAIEGGTNGLQLILEKDFACLDRSDAENQDTFPNPLVETSCS